MRAFSQSVWILGFVALVGCTQSVTPPSLQSLAGSEQVSVLCRDMTTGEGRDRRACPDSDDAISDGEDRHTLALVTQKYRGEVAVVDLHSQTVLDANPLVQGKEFLPVGKDPVAIASTPGGVATFVATGETGFEAIYALPTTCITAPEAGSDDEARKHARELSLWSACRLPPGRPGRMQIITDSTPAAMGSGALGYRSSCGGAVADPAWQPDTINSATYCPADLTVEEQIAPVGRRKLLVTLPELGLLAIYDAQAILNLEPGSFGNCVPDAVLRLASNVPPRPTDQVIPADWPDGKAPEYPDFEPRSGDAARPAGIALADDNKLYVADIGLPLVHVVDLNDPCTPVEQKPLFPLDFDNPSRVVLTSEVAVSGVTLEGRAKHQRFLYAVDYDGPATVDYDTILSSSSVLAFDLSDGASRTPIVRSHILDLPFDPADRIRFEAPVKKLQIVTHDAPAIDPVTKTSEVGIACNPYPDAEGTGPLYRTSSAFDKGAGPRKLRGVFGAVTLATGQVLAVDIEDWDAPCRRPKSNNPSDKGVDWLGCARDTALASQYNDWFVAGSDPTSDQPSVTDESSCNVFEPHRMRSGRYIRTDSKLGALAPSLTAFPRLSSKESGDLPTGISDVGHKQPQMLAVPYIYDESKASSSAPLPSDVFLNVGTARYEQHANKQSLIDVDPGSAERNTLILPLNEPRVYYTYESFSATYEGAVIRERGSGWLPRYATDVEAGQAFGGGTIEQATQILLRDQDALFCANGVEDYEVTRQTGIDSFGLTDPDQLDSFAAAHADFVVFTNDFDPADPFWGEAVKQAKRDDPNPYCPKDIADPYNRCLSWFGTRDEPKDTREFMVRRSQNDDLVIVPRNSQDAQTWVMRAHCCFRNVASYEVRAGRQWVVRGSSLLSQITEGTDDATGLKHCSRDASPRRAKLRSRVFEIASSTACAKDATGNLVSKDCAVGPIDATGVVEVCQTTDASKGIRPQEFGSSSLPAACLYDSLKGRFAIYRGQQPSTRDMAFTWAVSGGFSALGATIASSTVGYNVLPTDMVYSESLDAFVIIDGASGGLNLVGVANFSALGQPYL